jgi:hypothetical protein
MPTISRFFGITIAMFFDDHGFPHFHARHAEGEAKAGSTTSRSSTAAWSPAAPVVLAWAELHQEELEENWRGEVDVLDRMRGPIFEDARTREGFVKVAVDRETGTVVWPGGADLAPNTLYERVRSDAWPDTQAAA